MPPWKSEPGYGDFVGQTPLTDEEIGRIQRWVAEGAAQGNTQGIPEPKWTAGWQLGTPDLVLKLPTPYVLRADGNDVWRVFVLPVPVAAVRYVRGLEFHPGNARVVHHARIRVDATPASRQLDEEDPAPGYDGLILRSAVYPDGHFLGWTPGQAGPLLPQGLAWRLQPHTDLVVEVHMVPSGKPETVDPSIGLFFGSGPPDRTPAILRLGRQTIDIAPGEKEYVSTDSFVVPVDVEVQAVQPHAHYRAREIRGIATLPDGTTRWLIYIKDWDVRWQHLYQYVTPVALPKGTTVSMRYTFDNSAENPRNPQLPPRRVFWGEAATSEMGELWVQVLTRTEGDLRTLNATIRPKMIAEDAAGYESRLRQDPSNVQLHADAAEAYLSIGRPREAAAHFEAFLAKNPSSAAAHYNLATTLAELGRLDQAIAHFERALEIKPDYALAHVNFGTILSRVGKQEEALAHFREAVRLDPANANALFNVGGILRWRGDFGQAVSYFRRAVAIDPDWVPAVASLGWLLATAADAELRNTSDAIRLAQHAVDLTEGRDPEALDILAAAYASGEQFDHALALLANALSLKPNLALAAAILQRQALYEDRKPYILR